jgi:hypothetical protein
MNSTSSAGQPDMSGHVRTTSTSSGGMIVAVGRTDTDRALYPVRLSGPLDARSYPDIEMENACLPGTGSFPPGSAAGVAERDIPLFATDLEITT